MKVLFIRHAESENNLKLDMPKDQYQDIRNDDPSITEKGKIQSEKLGLYLMKKKLKMKKLYCSAMHRSLETAAIVQRLVKVDVKIKLNIHEVGGIYKKQTGMPGKNRSWIAQHYPTIHLCEGITDSGWFRKEFRETREEGFDRAREVIEELYKWGEEEIIDDTECIGMVTHGAFMDLLLAVLLDRREDSKIKLVHSNTGITTVEFKKDRTFRLVNMNMAEHLEDDFSVLALETAKDASSLEEKEVGKEAGKEVGRIPFDRQKHNRSNSTGYSIQKELQNIKAGIKNKKNLETHAESDASDSPLYQQGRGVPSSDEVTPKSRFAKN